MANKVKVEIGWCKEKKRFGCERTRQTKTFDSEIDAVAWCRRNAKHIVTINDSRPLMGDTFDHFMIIAAIRGDYYNI